MIDDWVKKNCDAIATTIILVTVGLFVFWFIKEAFHLPIKDAYNYLITTLATFGTIGAAWAAVYAANSAKKISISQINKDKQQNTLNYCHSISNKYLSSFDKINQPRVKNILVKKITIENQPECLEVNTFISELCEIISQNNDRTINILNFIKNRLQQSTRKIERIISLYTAESNQYISIIDLHTHIKNFDHELKREERDIYKELIHLINFNDINLDKTFHNKINFILYRESQNAFQFPNFMLSRIIEEYKIITSGNEMPQDYYPLSHEMLVHKFKPTIDSIQSRIESVIIINNNTCQKFLSNYNINYNSLLEIINMRSIDHDLLADDIIDNKIYSKYMSELYNAEKKLISNILSDELLHQEAKDIFTQKTHKFFTLNLSEC